jgi:DNA-binding MarR family transcriptional regulator
VGSIKELSKKTQLDYWNTMSWVKDLEHAGLVRVEKGKGNKKIIYLTDEGKELAGLVVRLLSKERELLKDEEEFYEIV